jgi:hypothetical protein
MKITTRDDDLTIDLEGWEQVWAIKRRIVVPREAVAGAEFHPERPAMKDLWRYLRVPGTSLPWVFLAGTFRTLHKHEFWYLLMRRPGYIVIDLKPRAHTYTRIRLTVSAGAGHEVEERWRRVAVASNP